MTDQETPYRQAEANVVLRQVGKPLERTDTTETNETTWDKPEELMTPEELSSTGEWVWVPHPDEVFVPARKLAEKGGKLQVRTARCPHRCFSAPLHSILLASAPLPLPSSPPNTSCSPPLRHRSTGATAVK